MIFQARTRRAATTKRKTGRPGEAMLLDREGARARFTMLSASGTIGLLLVHRDDGARLALQIQADTLKWASKVLGNYSAEYVFEGYRRALADTHAEIAKLEARHAE